MAIAVFILCAFTSIACAAMLWRGYRKSKSNLLLWSSISFLGLALNNILLFLDLVIFTQIDLFMLRNLVGALSGLVLLYGLIWEVEN